jgi:hypothetical protein
MTPTPEPQERGVTAWCYGARSDGMRRIASTREFRRALSNSSSTPICRPEPSANGTFQFGYSASVPGWSAALPDGVGQRDPDEQRRRREHELVERLDDLTLRRFGTDQPAPLEHTQHLDPLGAGRPPHDLHGLHQEPQPFAQRHMLLCEVARRRRQVVCRDRREREPTIGLGGQRGAGGVLLEPEH